MVVKLKNFEKHSGGLHWEYVNGENSVSIICHDYSYGHQYGLFETQCSWKEDVQGSLTFQQIADTLKELEEMDENVKSLENGKKIITLKKGEF